jgi:hypothetical protein
MAFSTASTLELRFQQSETEVGLVDPARSPGYRRFRRGPLLLGHTASGLRPVFDVLDPLSGSEQSVQVLFAIPGSIPARSQTLSAPSDPLQTSLASDVATLALASYRKSPDDPVAQGLFSALQAESTVFDAFVWEQPQKVTQVVLEWAQTAQPPSPAGVVLRWLPAGAVAATNRTAADVNRGLREKQGAGVIGDGRRWMFTLSRELGQGAIDNIAVLAPKGTDVRTAPERILVLTR